MLLAGVAAGVLGSRLLPPLLAAGAASGRVRVGGDPFDLLISDHRKITSLLDQMVAAPTAPIAQRARLFLELKRKLAKHAMAEEDVIYPIVRNDSASGDQRKHLYDEHADMKILMYELEMLLKGGEDWTAVVVPLRDLIRHHIDEEEGTVFPELRRELAKAKLPDVAGKISREEALVL
jgi:hemerythrin superfamily protein